MGSHFSATIGGAQYQAQCILDQLVASERFDIYYLARAIDPSFIPNGYTIRQITKPNWFRHYSFSFDTRALLSLLKELRPDVIYQRGLKAHTGIAAYYGRRSGCQTVFHISSDLNVAPPPIDGPLLLRWLQHIDRRIEEYGIEYVTDIVAQTNQQADLLFHNYGRRASAVVPNFHPVPEEMIEKDDSQVRILWVANFKEVKRPEVFVRLAESLVNERELRFVMIGRPGEGGRYGDLHSEIRRLPNMDYRGQLPIEAVNAELANAHLFVNTSSAEGFPNTFIQAWMRRVPTLSLGVNPDGVFDSQRIGFCAASFEELRARTIELARNHQLRDAMGATAERYALETHSPRAVDRIIQLFDRTETGKAQ